MFPKDAEGLVGLIVLEPMADHLFIGNIAVGPRCQGRGLGSELLAFAEGRACAAGFRGATALYQRSPRAIRSEGMAVGEPYSVLMALIPGLVVDATNSGRTICCSASR